MGSVSDSKAVTIAIDSSKLGASINPYIYGQFIEHLGRCIYGGIWAEMLEDRKFYYEVSEPYAPYTDYKDTAYPVVGASPWEIIGEGAVVIMDRDNPFVGKQSVEVHEGAGIRQNDLGVVVGKSYVGYIWCRAAGSGASNVSVSLGGETESFSRVELSVNCGDFEKYEFVLKAFETTDHASLAIHAESGDLLIGTLSLMPEDHVDGMRADTLELLRELGGSIYRWPGGNFTSGYDWRDGIGDRDRRPPRKNPAWTGVEHNDFGTDEFMAFCKAVDADPMIAVNTGYGDAYSAGQWVQYCNGSSDTLAGGWRAGNGHESAYAVKHWCVGNEMYGPWQLGFMSLAHYQIKHNLVAEAMLEADADIQLAAVGCFEAINKEHDPEQAKSGIPWSEGMLMACADHMHLISEHFYCGRLPWEQADRYPLEESVTQLKREIRKRTDAHRKMQPGMPSLKGRTIPITMDEWNYWHRDYIYGELGCSYDLADGLGVAEGLHEYFRQSDIIDMAFYAQTVNVIGAIKTSRTHAQMETTGLVMAMYRAHFGVLPIDLGDEYAPLDVVAALTEDGKHLTLGVVNPTMESVVLQPDVSSLSLKGDATGWSVTGADESVRNVPGKERLVDIKELEGLSASAGLEVPSLSATIFELPLL